MIDGDVMAMSTWDVGELRSAVDVLEAVLDRLPAVRHRFDEVTRTVWSGAVWSGPAGLAAAGALSRMSAVAHSAGGDLEDSIGWLRRAMTEVAQAQEVAGRAAAAGDRLRHGSGTVAVGGAGAADLDLTALSAQVGALEDLAREHASAAVAAATRATASVPRLEAVTGLAPTGWGGAPGGLPGGYRVEPPVMPTGRSPEDTAAWWSVLSPAQQWAAIGSHPHAVGALAGVPAWARDRANRAVLARALATSDDADRYVAAAVTQEIADREAAGETVQLLELDVHSGLAAVALGDLDAADAVGVLVPGTGADVVEDLDDLVDDADAVAGAVRAAGPGLAVAAVAWLSYRAPSNLVKAYSSHHAEAGGRALDRTLHGLAAARAAAGRARPQTTVIGHSYGTVVIDRAADEPGRLPADDIVLLGSPGMDNRAADLEVGAVHEASAPFDPVTADVEGMGLHGWATDGPFYGAAGLPTDWDNWHLGYYDEDGPTLPAIGEVVAGVR